MNIINHQSDFWGSHKLKFGWLGKHYCESHPKEKKLYKEVVPLIREPNSSQHKAENF
jgi:hypothetical protein